MKKSDHEGKSFLAMLVIIFMPLILILAGAGLVVLAFVVGSLPLGIFGAVLALAGVLWGAIMVALNGVPDIF